MVNSSLRVGILLVVLCVADGQSTTSENSHCSYIFKVPASDCNQKPGEDQFLKSSVMALQAQFKLLAGKQNEDIRKLTDENERLRQEITTIKAGNT